jgi:hypothetical protein
MSCLVASSVLIVLRRRPAILIWPTEWIHVPWIWLLHHRRIAIICKQWHGNLWNGARVFPTQRRSQLLKGAFKVHFLLVGPAWASRTAAATLPFIYFLLARKSCFPLGESTVTCSAVRLFLSRLHTDQAFFFMGPQSCLNPIAQKGREGPETYPASPHPFPF